MFLTGCIWMSCGSGFPSWKTCRMMFYFFKMLFFYVLALSATVEESREEQTTTVHVHDQKEKNQTMLLDFA